MTRRALLCRLAAAALGVALMRTLPGIAPRSIGDIVRQDVLYGYGIWNADFAVRVQG